MPITQAINRSINQLLKEEWYKRSSLELFYVLQLMIY